MAREWTAAQAAAIGERNKTLLVSAAAGSGKTATLTERIIRSLTDEAAPGDISRMLVVTFTRASAADLRQKIAAALQDAMATGRARAHLSRQLLLLPGAQISTIDSFCMNLVRENAVRLGLSPAFRMADAAEGRLLAESVMERLIEDGYEGSATDFAGGGDFCALADCLTGNRGDADLGSLLLSLYQSTQGFARSYHILSDMAEALRATQGHTPLQTPHGRYLAVRAGEQVAGFVARYASAMATLVNDPLAAAAYLPAMEEEYAALLHLRDALAVGQYTAVRAVIADFPHPRAKALRADQKSEAALAAAALRHALSRMLAQLSTRYFAYSEEDWAPMQEALYQKLRLLSDVITAFGGRLHEEKRRRGLCDFQDLAHGALRLLYNEEGAKTPLCYEIASRFDAVYIDEYQDVNEVQHRIFEAISHPRGRFMVGDVKQSIYGFRGAQPEIFASIRAAFLPLAQTGIEDETASLSLSANFRSAAPILSFVNLVFGGLMQGVGAHIGYDAAADALQPGLPDVQAGPEVTLALFQKEAQTGGEETPDATEVDENEEEPVDAEARYVAGEIGRLLREGLSGHPILPGDIAILARTGATCARFAAALAEAGIPLEKAQTRTFFLNPEILLAVSLLNVIDNPRRDVYLAGLLRSPLYGFTLDDLIALRRSGGDAARDGSLYEALLSYMTTHLDFEKGERFLADLSAFRAMAEGMPVDRLIWQLYRHTGLLALAGADKTGAAAARRANLMLLYDYARRFEASSFRGLYHFIDYINEVMARDQSIEEGRVQSDRADTVKIMTIHQSKGLEYPVCFVVGCGKPIRLRDAQGPLLFDRTLGCAMKLRDASGLHRVRNPIYTAIGERMVEKQLEEEMRVLYVALTRPRTKLYVTATVKEIEQAKESGRERHRHLGAADVYACRSYLDMILMTAVEGDACFCCITPEIQQNEPPRVVQEIEGGIVPAAQAEDSAAIEALLRERFADRYPDRYLSTLPSKLSVSHLYPSLLDESEAVPTVPGLAGEDGERVAQEQEGGGEKKAPLPLFMGGVEEAGAARAGTATHLFMQFCDLERLQANGAAQELRRLQEAAFLTPADAALCRLPEIEAFARSALFFAMRETGCRLYRELRFHIRLPAAAFTQEAEKKEAYRDHTVLVQGVMDAVLLRPDGRLWLIDYKTDRLTQAERQSPAVAAEKMCKRHGQQLAYYAAACREMFGRAPDRVLLYALHLGDVIELPPQALCLPQ